MRTPEVKKAFTTTKEKLRRSSQAKTQVTRYAYNDYMVHQYAFTMRVAAKQEPERPSLHHKLEGENRPNRNSPNRRKEIREDATKPRRTAQQRRKEPRNKAAQEPRKPTKKDASRSTDFATTHNASWSTDSTTPHKCESTRTPERELKRTSDTFRNRPDLSLRGRVENQTQTWSSV